MVMGARIGLSLALVTASLTGCGPIIGLRDDYEASPMDGGVGQSSLLDAVGGDDSTMGAEDAAPSNDAPPSVDAPPQPCIDAESDVTEVSDAGPDAPSGADAAASAPFDAAVDAGADAGVDAGADSGPTCLAKPSGIVSFFTGDDETADRGTAGNSLLWSGLPKYAPAKVGDGFSADGTVALRIPSPTGLDGLQGFSIEAWLDPAQVTGADVVSRWTTATGWRLMIKGGGLRFDMAPGTISYSNNVNLAVSTLTHVAVTFDGKAVSFYIDGALDAVHPLLADGGTLPLPVDGDVYVAAVHGTRPTFTGLIDELTLYSRALTKAEVLSIYQAGSNGKCRQ